MPRETVFLAVHCTPEFRQAVQSLVDTDYARRRKLDTPSNVIEHALRLVARYAKRELPQRARPHGTNRHTRHETQD